MVSKTGQYLDSDSVVYQPKKYDHDIVFIGETSVPTHYASGHGIRQPVQELGLDQQLGSREGLHDAAWSTIASWPAWAWLSVGHLCHSTVHWLVKNMIPRTMIISNIFICIYIYYFVIIILLLLLYVFIIIIIVIIIIVIIIVNYHHYMIIIVIIITMNDVYIYILCDNR